MENNLPMFHKKECKLWDFDDFYEFSIKQNKIMKIIYDHDTSSDIRFCHPNNIIDISGSDPTMFFYTIFQEIYTEEIKHTFLQSTLPLAVTKDQFFVLEAKHRCQLKLEWIPDRNNHLNHKLVYGKTLYALERIHKFERIRVEEEYDGSDYFGYVEEIEEYEENDYA